MNRTGSCWISATSITMAPRVPSLRPPASQSPGRAGPLLAHGAGRRRSRGPVAVASAGSASPNGSGELGRRKKVVVIGGGWAGFGAAKHLVDQDFDVTLLDASKNAGGLSQGFRKSDDDSKSYPMEVRGRQTLERDSGGKLRPQRTNEQASERTTDLRAATLPSLKHTNR